MLVDHLYALLGEDKLTAIVHGFYKRVKTDPILSPMYPQSDFEGAQRRLLGFILFRTGGPDTYIKERGHPRLRMRHMPFAVDQSARDRWVKLMDESIDENHLDPEPASVLKSFLHDTATAMMNRPG